MSNLRAAVPRLVGPAVIALAFGAMALATWRGWPDVLIDYGKELTIAWELAEGRALYRDVAYFLGPLSPYLNALWFKLAGVSLGTLVYANLAIAVLVTALLYAFFRRIASELAAFTATLIFVLCFCFAQYVGVGNYNWITPYVHEVTHGGLLGLCALWSACAAFKTADGQRTRWLITAGVVTGLVFLTRVEMFVATAAGVAVVVAALRSARAALVALGAACVPIAVAFALLCLELSPSEAAAGIAASYRSMGVASSTFFRGVSGTQDVGASLLDLFKVAGVELPLVVALAFVALRWPLPADERRRRVMASVAFAAVAAVAWIAREGIPWHSAFRPLPLYVAAIAAAALRPLRVERLAFAVFALALLGKIMLNARLYHYGFALAMPAMLVLVLALVDWIPRALDARRAGSGALFCGAALGLLAVFTLVQTDLTLEWHAHKDVVVGRGPDQFHADQRGAFVRLALDQLEATPRDATLAVLPEGAMINFLARRRNPTPFLNFMPTEFTLWREADMIAAFERTRPDFILLVHKDTSEYGVHFFGQDYARELFAWVLRSYSPVWSAGARPFTSPAFGMLLLRRAR